MTKHISTLIEESETDPEAAMQLAEELHMWCESATMFDDFRDDLHPSAHLRDTVEEILANSPDSVAEKFEQLSGE